MLCPFCTVQLNAVRRHGIEIDLCPICKGVWLERGELDKILDAAAEETARRSTARVDARVGAAAGRPEDPTARREAPPRSRDDDDDWDTDLYARRRYDGQGDGDERPDRARDDRDRDRDDRRYPPKKKRARSLLSDLFDFD